MAGLTNFTIWVPPVPIPPIAPDFVFCHSAYGRGLSHLRETALRVAGTLPRDTSQIEYTVNDEEVPYNVYDLPYQTHVGSPITITVDVSGPVNIRTIRLVPNNIRNMAAYVATRCIGNEGNGGFITMGIQHLVNFVTDPRSNLEAPIYPPDSVFVTVLASDVRSANSFPGDNDPELAHFLLETENTAYGMAQPQYRDLFRRRMLKYSAQYERMTRLGRVSWWDEEDVGRNETVTATSQPKKPIVQGVATSRRKKRLR
ncbi:hypothetical protein N7G274_009036 [Stereocaulon virgatum]|uniref:Uncharacterized protein n=1 Tax=Stereocaulon virgatum TaxID=373712 RepID=A0ABR3ZZW9_9LECA